MDRIRTQHSWSIASPGSLLRTVILASFVAVVSYVCAVVGGALVLRPQMVWPLWPGCAFLVAVMLLTPRKTWPLLLVSGLAAFLLYDLRIGLAIRSIALLLLADTVEVLVAALGVSSAFSGLPRLNSIKSLAKYFFFAVILAPVSVASVGALALGGRYWVSWRISFFTEALALLTLTPAILSWTAAAPTWAEKSYAYYREAAALIGGLIVIGYITFVVSGASVAPVLLYSLVPFLLWSALRFGTVGISTSMLVVSFLAIWGATHAHGPFTGLAPLSNVLALQLFLLVAATSFMILGALVEEHKEAQQALRESEKRFRLVANTAPVMIWMSGPDMLCTYFNQPWLEFTGRPIEAELGNGWAEGVHPQDLKLCLDIYSKASEAREPFKIQYRLRRHDGEYRWVSGVGVPRFNPDGSFAGHIGSCTDVTERKMVEDALASLSGRLIEAQEEERRRIAREVHDDYQQRLAVMAIDLEGLAQNIGDTPADASQRLYELWNRVSELGADLHDLSHRLHSSTLENLGLVAGVRSFCEEFADQQGLQVDFAHENVPRAIPGDVALCLFRVAQEGLRNVKRHSGSNRAEVRLEGLGEKLHLSISDRGRGFDSNGGSRSGGIGLRSMEERLRLLGGRLEIYSRPLEGTRIDAWLLYKVASQRAG